MTNVVVETTRTVWCPAVAQIPHFIDLYLAKTCLVLFRNTIRNLEPQNFLKVQRNTWLQRFSFMHQRTRPESTFSKHIILFLLKVWEAIINHPRPMNQLHKMASVLFWTEKHCRSKSKHYYAWFFRIILHEVFNSENLCVKSVNSPSKSKRGATNDQPVTTSGQGLPVVLQYLILEVLCVISSKHFLKIIWHFVLITGTAMYGL